MTKKRPSFSEAKAQYINRFTMEHVPNWARQRAPNGKYYAPHFRSDTEWYANTLFPGEPGSIYGARSGQSYARNESWPLGKWLNSPFGERQYNPLHRRGPWPRGKTPPHLKKYLFK